MGTCEYPNNMSCNQEGHKVMDDFTALIEDLFVNANPAVSDNFNPYLSQSFTSLLASYFGNNNIYYHALFSTGCSLYRSPPGAGTLNGRRRKT